MCLCMCVCMSVYHANSISWDVQDLIFHFKFPAGCVLYVCVQSHQEEGWGNCSIMWGRGGEECWQTMGGRSVEWSDVVRAEGNYLQCEFHTATDHFPSAGICFIEGYKCLKITSFCGLLWYICVCVLMCTCLVGIGDIVIWRFPHCKSLPTPLTALTYGQHTPEADQNALPLASQSWTHVWRWLNMNTHVVYNAWVITNCMDLPVSRGNS